MLSSEQATMSAGCFAFVNTPEVTAFAPVPGLGFCT